MGLAESLDFKSKQTGRVMWDLRTAKSLLDKQIPLPIGSQSDLVDLLFTLMAREGRYAVAYALAREASGVNYVPRGWGWDSESIPVYRDHALRDVIQTWAIVSKRKTALKALRAFNKTFGIGMSEETPNG